MLLKNKLTIVIPCKNEGLTVKTTLQFLNCQSGIDGVKVIVADSSNDYDLTRNLILSENYKKILIQIIDGGFPAFARNQGAKLVTTPYVLFMDADVFITEFCFLERMMDEIEEHDCDLLTCKFRTKKFKYNFVYWTFDIVQWVLSLTSPFAVGGFMLFRKSKFDELGGFCDEDKFAEDYHLSSKVKPSNFRISNNYVSTLNRRFKQKGVWYMVKMMIKTWFNRHDDNFYKQEHNYWK